MTIRQFFIHYLKINNIYGAFLEEVYNSRYPINIILKWINPLKLFPQIRTCYIRGWDDLINGRNTRLFLQFLEDNGIKKLFEQRLIESGDSLTRYLQYQKKAYIKQAFSWARTPEGYTYWEEFSNKLENFMNEQNKSYSEW